MGSQLALIAYAQQAASETGIIKVKLGVFKILFEKFWKWPKHKRYKTGL